MHKVYTELVTTAFSKDASFVQALDTACTAFMNKNAVTDLAKSSAKSPELLARYCDVLLKKSAKNPQDAELEEIIAQIVRCFSGFPTRC